MATPERSIAQAMYHGRRVCDKGRTEKKIRGQQHTPKGRRNTSDEQRFEKIKEQHEMRE